MHAHASIDSSAVKYVGSELDVFALATNWKAYAASLLREHLRGDVLEVGGGIGTTAKALVHSGVGSWTSVEPDPELAAILRDVVLDPSGSPSFEAITGTLAAVPQGRSFDTILYFDVLEHIEDDRGEVLRAERLLRPGGRLIVAAPAFNAVFSNFDRAIGHVRRYTARSLAAVMPPTLLRRNVFYADALALLLSVANRLLLRQAMPTESQILLWDRRIVPLSRLIDPLFRRVAGRTVFAVYERPISRN